MIQIQALNRLSKMKRIQLFKKQNFYVGVRNKKNRISSHTLYKLNQDLSIRFELQPVILAFIRSLEFFVRKSNVDNFDDGGEGLLFTILLPFNESAFYYIAMVYYRTCASYDIVLIDTRMDSDAVV